MGSKVSAVQTGKDGLGQPKTVTGIPAIRLKAKEVSVSKNTTLKVTGNTTGTTWTIDVVVQSGSPVGSYTPPPVQQPTPVSSFTHNVQGQQQQQTFNQQNPGFNASSGPPNLSNL
tara:strand:- start:1379 stop:1723 length:345 start_codon:yes stop_codon:yes gene_type:complete